MIEVTVTTSGLDLRALPVGKMSREITEEVAEFAYREMLVRVPFRTGRLRSSIGKRVKGNEAEVGPRSPYALFVEKGTIPHIIMPVNARALRFEIRGEGIVFSKIVHHPGTRPQPFIQETIEATRRKIPELWKKVWDTI